MIHPKSVFERGMTLVELLVVMGVLGVLAAIAVAVVNPTSQLGKANDARRKSDLFEVQKALELYYQDFQRYPTINEVRFGQPFSPYIQRLPQDPLPGKNYSYRTTTQQEYYLFASLDNWRNDPQTCTPSTNNKCTNAPVGVCGAGAVCNYGVSSPNVSP